MSLNSQIAVVGAFAFAIMVGLGIYSARQLEQKQAAVEEKQATTGFEQGNPVASLAKLEAQRLLQCYEMPEATRARVYNGRDWPKPGSTFKSWDCPEPYGKIDWDDIDGVLFVYTSEEVCAELIASDVQVVIGKTCVKYDPKIHQAPIELMDKRLGKAKNTP